MIPLKYAAHVHAWYWQQDIKRGWQDLYERYGEDTCRKCNALDPDCPVCLGSGGR